MSQGEKFYFYSLHPSNPHWAKAENMEGKVGFVPTSYIMVSYTKFFNFFEALFIRYTIWMKPVWNPCSLCPYYPA